MPYKLPIVGECRLFYLLQRKIRKKDGKDTYQNSLFFSTALIWLEP